MGMVTVAFVMGIADGPTEVHKVTVAKQVLKDYSPVNDLFPSYHIPNQARPRRRKRFADDLKVLKRTNAKRGKAQPRLKPTALETRYSPLLRRPRRHHAAGIDQRAGPDPGAGSG